MTPDSALDHFARRRLIYGVVPVSMLVGIIAVQARGGDLTFSSTVASVLVLLLGIALFVPSRGHDEPAAVLSGSLSWVRAIAAGAGGAVTFVLIDVACLVIAGDRTIGNAVSSQGIRP